MGGKDERVNKTDTQHAGISDFLSVWLRGESPLKQKPYWGNHFWAKGYCVDTIELDPEMIRTSKFVLLLSVIASES